jgi:hypothetical protein
MTSGAAASTKATYKACKAVAAALEKLPPIG